MSLKEKLLNGFLRFQEEVSGGIEARIETEGADCRKRDAVILGVGFTLAAFPPLRTPLTVAVGYSSIFAELTTGLELTRGLGATRDALGKSAVNSIRIKPPKLHPRGNHLSK